MTSLRRDAIVGFTALLGVVGLAITLMMFGDLAWVSPQRYDVNVVVPDAKGLTPNVHVTLNGVRVGRISAIVTGKDPTRGATMTLAINEGVRIPRDVTLTVQKGLLGESSLDLVTVMRGLDADPLPESAFLQPDERFVSSATSNLEQLADRLEQRLGGFSEAAQSVTELADTYNALGEDLRAIVSPLAGNETPSIKDTLARLNTALDGAEAWLGDDELRTGISGSVEEARAAFEKLGNSAQKFQEVGETIAKASRDAGEDLDEGVARFVTAAESMTAALEEIRVVASRVNQGEGTLGQLLVNPDLFRNLNDAADRLDKALLEAQLLLEKYRREGVPIQF